MFSAFVFCFRREIFPPEYFVYTLGGKIVLTKSKYFVHNLIYFSFENGFSDTSLTYNWKEKRGFSYLPRIFALNIMNPTELGTQLSNLESLSITTPTHPSLQHQIFPSCHPPTY